eukprot:gene14285-17366_t
MNSTFYIPRRLSSNDGTIKEEALLAASNHIVVLAEPGGGKTELLKSLARQLGVSCVTANAFRHIGTKYESSPLIIDAFDELSKIDKSGIYELLAKIKNANPTYVIISSRSSEWDSAATNSFKEFLGHPPLLVRLSEFIEEEQKLIFHNYLPNENFLLFQIEVSKFDLSALLPNPQFLKLFADAYIESNRFFTDKRSIFSQAVERLAKEANTDVTTPNPSLSITQKIEISSEVFAKILLSGAEGISTNEATENRTYPLLASLFCTNILTGGILATRLFKPGDSANQHRPVHKIVAEYCAAGYFTKRISNEADPLTLSKCLAIIAPNSSVRDELRGLLGWMASLGTKSIEEAIIELDAYAVLSNGDPSQLEHSSKRLLITCLKKTEARDPYFRRGDFWRKFSISGFFTEDIVNEIKPLLKANNDGHLRNLLLELLAESNANTKLTTELRELMLNSKESKNTRLLASKCLLDIADYDHLPDLAVLIFEASNDSLSVAADIIAALGPKTFKNTYLAGFFRVCAHLHPNTQEHADRTIGSRHFIKSLIETLDLTYVDWLLEELTSELTCTCEKQPYECYCRIGISKVIGSLLDHYFELTEPPVDPKRVWNWVKNIKFYEYKTTTQSKAVKALKEDEKLRQGIISHVFETMTDQNLIFDTKMHNFDWHSHSGLSFQPQDYKYIVDLAFIVDNSDLWRAFIATHQYYRKKDDRGTNSLRHHMRAQAMEKPSFMSEWVKSNRAIALSERENRLLHRHTRKIKRYRRQRKNLRAANIEYIKENRKVIEIGEHWDFLSSFAMTALSSPDKLDIEFGDEILVRNSLRNCIQFLSPHIPDVSKLAELQCKSMYSPLMTILYAACMENLRTNDSLKNIELRLLKSLRTHLNMHYRAISKEERLQLKTEIDHLIFCDSESAKCFLQEYLEPQLSDQGCANPQLYLLQHDQAFSHLRATLSIEWLRRFPKLALEPLNTLFEISAQFGNRGDLNSIIAERCAEFTAIPSGDGEGIDHKHTFWFIRAWYFLESPPTLYWDYLKTNNDIVHLLYEQSGRATSAEHPYWPKLTPGKIENILDAFIEKWPKVQLPNHWGSDSPKEENAYRFFTEVIWSIGSDEPDDAIPVLGRLLADPRFSDLHNDLKSMHAAQMRKIALRYFEPPTPYEIVNQLDRDEVVTVEGLRQLVVQELQEFQKAITGGEYNSVNRFYENSKRLDEERCTEIIAERLSLKLQPKNITITSEHHLKASKRSDFTVAKYISGKRRLLVTEVKGQWHRDLYTAANAQLYELYSIHPDADQQGILIVVWFGANEIIAGRKNHGIESAQQLRSSIELALPAELYGLIDVFVLDSPLHGCPLSPLKTFAQQLKSQPKRSARIYFQQNSFTSFA